MQPGGKWQGKQLSSRDKKLYQDLQLTPEERQRDRLLDMTDANVEELLRAIEVNRNRPAIQRELQGELKRIEADRRQFILESTIAPQPAVSAPMDAPSIIDRIINFFR